MMTLFRIILMSLGLLVLAACGTTSAALDVGMSLSEFREATPEARSAELERKRQQTAIDKEWELVTLQAGEPVPFEFEGTGYTLQCHRFPGSTRSELAVYHGHNAPGWNRLTHQSLAVYTADENCILVLTKAPGNPDLLLPITIRNNSAAQSDYWRAFTLGVTPTLVNGVGLQVSKKLLGDDCGDNCGPSFTIMGGQGGSAANVTDVTTGLTSDTNIGIGLDSFCSGGCGGMGAPTD